MQEITPEVVRHVALLSRLELTDEEASRYAEELGNILHYVDKLSELDTSSVPPTSHSLALQNVFRQDVRRPSLSNEEALSNAPESEDGCFRVPAVIQEGGGA
ncbi:MAG: Asp-tRNA(Asn)/Glu-tRNA(Gln) amidotransferase subunit GatC [Candidatus Sumerlaeaceae bacterium]